MKTATSVVLMATAGLLIVCGVKNPPATPGGDVSASPQTPAPEVKPPYGGASPIPQDREVEISIEGRTLRVKPNDALIHVGRPLRFSAQGLRDGLTIEVDFEVTESHHKGPSRSVKGPFPHGEHPANPVRGRFVLSEKNPRVDTEASDIAGYFKYHVVLRRGTEDLFALDPGVVVKNDY
jgi:hypothetical protein